MIRQAMEAQAVGRRAISLALKPESGSPPRVSMEKENAAGSPLESKLMDCWQRCSGPTLTREAKLVPLRRFRCDFYDPVSKVVIECEGMGLGHQGFVKFRQDAFKYFSLAMQDIAVIRLTGDLITDENIAKIISFMARRKNLKKPRRSRKLDAKTEEKAVVQRSPQQRNRSWRAIWQIHDPNPSTAPRS